MIKLLAWIVGITVFGALFAGTSFLAAQIGLPSYIDFGDSYLVTRGSGRYSYDEEVSGQFTDFGSIVLVLSAMLGSRAGMAVFHQELRGGIRGASALEFRAWFIGLLYLAVFAAILHLAFANFDSRGAGVIRMGIMLGAAILVWRLQSGWLDRKRGILAKATSPNRMPS